ncbi:hypothetical protein BS78_K219400 [Paspalum vaginatum]|uniref:NB-ARC domain-containing protein n=1 Tax=Paspalum vaginatum TaxID=158149 RepID=A0A9W7XBD7_9POAL|nr:hypothetical protein BS78_K219400 [Paspalum vaginatum]
MDVVTGALGVVLPNLAELLKDEYNLHKNVKKDIDYPSKDLESMQAALRIVGEVPPEQLDELMSYDMEAIVDTFLLEVQRPEPHIKGIAKSFINRLNEMFDSMKEMFNKVWDSRGIGQEIKDMKERVKEAAERRDRYKVDAIVPAKTTSFDPRVTALYTKLTELVGIDEAREELITRVRAEDDTATQQQRIISIAGFGGLGKTTLTKAVYDEIKMQFSCNAFISVSQNPDIKKLLKDILYGFDETSYRSIHTEMLDETQLIDLVREFLQNKRYFIVIDDIWSKEPWDILRCALIDNHLRSQIIITTRRIDVADQVGSYCHKLKPLSPNSSKTLFCRRIFSCGDILPEQYSKVSENFLNKCGGVPLAIIPTLGLLANKLGNVKEWYNICDSIGSGIGSNNYDMENMGKILSLRLYYDLPSHLKTCLLYLSIFPEDYKIRKNQLIWRWIGEGFVQHGGGGQSLFEIGESYLNELINRSLIQSTNYLDVLRFPSAYAHGSGYCSVHDMVHDLICSWSREENFVTIDLHDNNQNTRPSGSKICRLSLHGNTWSPMNISKRNMSNVRSLTVFGPCVINSMLSSIPSYHLLRVLDLESCRIDGDPSLMFIGKLLQLRYLRLPDRLYTCELLVEIAKLQHLQTLDLSGAFIGELPPCILQLRQLMFLSVKVFTRLPAGLGNLTSLEELMIVCLDSAQMAEELGRLTQLGCDLDGLTAECLGNLRYISMSGTSVLPRWINPAVLLLLSRRRIRVSQVRREDIQVLGTLQALSYLFLSVKRLDRPKLGRFVVGADAFRCLLECTLEGLQTFRFHIDLDAFTAGGGDLASAADDLALGHLPSLRKVVVCEHVAAGDEAAASSDGDEVATRVKEKLRHEAGVHPNKPSIDLRF